MGSHGVRQAHPERMGELFLLFGFAVGCAGMEASRRSPGVLANGSFSPSRPAATQYGPDSARTCPNSGPLPFLISDLEDRAKKSGQVAPQAEGRLCAAAETLLGWDQAELPDETVMRFVAWYFGLPAPASQVIIVPLESEDARSIAERLADPILKFAGASGQLRIGLASQRLHKGTTRIVLLLQDNSVELDPLPRALGLNTQATLSGRVVGDFASPKVLISDPVGHLEAPAPASGKEFRTDLRCGERPGWIRVAIIAEAKGGQSLVANFPVACGKELPSSVPVSPAKQGAGDVASQEHKLLESINAERAEAGLPALSWDENVAKVARATAQSESEAQRGGSVSSADLVERLKQADVMSSLVLQNPAQARTAEGAHARFSISPPHFSNYMSREATHAGIGVVEAPKEPNKASSVIVMEVFVKELPPVDIASLREKLKTAIKQKRADSRNAPLASDATLDSVAQKYVKELAGTKGNLPKVTADQILAPIYKSFRSVNMLSGAKAEPLDFAEEPGVKDKAKLMGIGVAQGTHPLLGKNAVYVVILIGTRR